MKPRFHAVGRVATVGDIIGWRRVARDVTSFNEGEIRIGTPTQWHYTITSNSVVLLMFPPNRKLNLSMTIPYCSQTYDSVISKLTTLQFVWPDLQ